MFFPEYTALTQVMCTINEDMMLCSCSKLNVCKLVHEISFNNLDYRIELWEKALMCLDFYDLETLLDTFVIWVK